MKVKTKSALIIYVCLSVIFLSSNARSQDKSNEGIDMAFENAIEHDAGGYTSLNPAVIASYSKNYLSYYMTATKPSHIKSKEGYGFVYIRKKHGLAFNIEHFSSNTQNYSLQLLGYGYRLTKYVYTGVNFESLNNDITPDHYEKRGIGVGVLYVPTNKNKIDFYIDNLYSEKKVNSGTWKTDGALPHLRYRHSFLKNNALSIGVQFDIYADVTPWLAGLSYRINKYGTMRFIYDDIRQFSIYGVSGRIKDLFLHFDYMNIPRTSDRSILSFTLAF